MKPPCHVVPIESLECRIAPAVIASPTAVTYTDIDGDAVTVQITRGTLAAVDFIFDSAFATVGAQQLLRIDFGGDLDKARTDLTVSVVAAGGDGVAHIGYVDASGIDLRKVTLPGDLGRITAGDAVTTTAAINELSVGSVGVRPLAATQQPGGTLLSQISGSVNSFTVSGDVNGASIEVAGAISILEIDGDLVGGVEPASGSIRVDGRIKQVHIGGDILGGDGSNSGRLFSRKTIDNVVLDGSLEGGNLAGSLRSGQIAANDRLGQVTIGGNIVGGAGDQSAQIAARDGILDVTVSGSLMGGVGAESGVIGSRGTIASILVKGGLTGGAGDTSGAVLADAPIDSVVIGEVNLFANIQGGTGDRSGIIASTKGIRDVIVHGSILGGAGDTSGAIGSTKALETIQVDGNVQGGVGPRSGEIVSEKSIRSIFITGSLLGGQGDESGAIGSSTTIQTIEIGGDLMGDIGFNSGWIVSGMGIGMIKIGGSAGTFGDGASGIIQSGGTIKAIAIAGDIGGVEVSPSFICAVKIGDLSVGGSILSSPDVPARITADKSIGSITVGKDVQGNARSFARASITAGTSIQSISIGGSISYGEIVVGPGFPGELADIPTNPDAKLESMIVGGSWVNTSVAVGTNAGSDGVFGTLDDQIGHGGNSAIFGTIGEIVIQGGVFASDAAGIVAEHIQALQINGTQVALKGGPLNDAVNVGSKGSSFYAREQPLRSST